MFFSEALPRFSNTSPNKMSRADSARASKISFCPKNAPHPHQRKETPCPRSVKKTEESSRNGRISTSNPKTKEKPGQGAPQAPHSAIATNFFAPKKNIRSISRRKRPPKPEPERTGGNLTARPAVCCFKTSVRFFQICRAVFGTGPGPACRLLFQNLYPIFSNSQSRVRHRARPGPDDTTHYNNFILYAKEGAR